MQKIRIFRPLPPISFFRCKNGKYEKERRKKDVETLHIAGK
jgi:hypothetical protein